jgi:hypothetical protein
MVFKFFFSLWNLMKWICTKLKCKDYCMFQWGIEKNYICSMLEHTWHIFETNVILHKKKFKVSYLHFLKPTFNLFLQWEILKLMHNNEF